MSTPSEQDRGTGAGLTTGAVARRLGVAPTTLRSWDRRYGVGPALRTGGRHRRWTPDDLAVLTRMADLTSTGVPPAEAARIARSAPRTPYTPAAVPGPRTAAGRPDADAGPPSGRVRRERRGLAGAALRLDADAVDALLDSVIRAHGLVTAWHEVIAPALRAVGRKQQSSGERYVEVEHLLSWHISCALRRGCATAAPERPGPPALLACLPGEGHTLPLEALAAALRRRGLPVRMFGAALPVEALDSAVRRTGPAAVVLWAQSRTTADRALARHVAGITWGVRGARARPLVLTAGPGWSGARVPGTVRPLGLAEAIDVLEPVLTPG
ncbi:MerR family transcriptional regulator [Streptomyces amakusaensis]|uniref:MerR family transcriptional regulator n=1 Tax=Streptomyces amakusaensis TaxID=67271 RepID=A0ABW0ALJ2_9ACTN